MSWMWQGREDDWRRQVRGRHLGDFNKACIDSSLDLLGLEVPKLVVADLGQSFKGFWKAGLWIGLGLLPKGQLKAKEEHGEVQHLEAWTTSNRTLL